MKSLKLIVAIVPLVFAFLMGGCAEGGASPETKEVVSGVALSTLLGLDIKDLREGGATQQEKDDFIEHAGWAAQAVGVETELGQTIAELTAEFVANGSINDAGWRGVLKSLLEWAAKPDPEPAPEPVQ